MNVLVTFLAVVGAFCLLCFIVILLLIGFAWLTEKSWEADYQ